MGALYPTNERIADRLELRAVTNEFHVTPITLFVLNEDTPTRWSEDSDIKGYTPHSLLCMDEYPMARASEVIVTDDGREELFEVKLTMNMDYLAEQGLVDTYQKMVVDASTDKVSLKGEMYNILAVRYEGPIDVRPVLGTLYLKKDNKLAA